MDAIECAANIKAILLGVLTTHHAFGDCEVSAIEALTTNETATFVIGSGGEFFKVDIWKVGS